LIDITERIKVDGKDISAKDFKNISEKYLSLAQKCGLTYFEYLTAIAFIYFAQRKTEIAFIETGLGGRFDATNVIKNPLACIITSIAFDHREILGQTIAKIAFEKAGIIKKNASVICGKLPKAALDVMKAKSSPFVFGRDFKALNVNYDESHKWKFDYSGLNAKIENIELSLRGKHQIINASVAACCAEVLCKKGFVINCAALKRSFSKTKWPARFDVRDVKFKNKRFCIIADGAHNEQGIEAFLGALRLYEKKKIDFLFASMREKEYKKIVKKVAVFADNVILPKLKSERALQTSELKKEFLKYKRPEKIFAVDSVSDAFEILKNKGTYAVAGSFYLAGEVLKNLNNKDQQNVKKTLSRHRYGRNKH
jgi:dihydrofolate synthase/folylpolyglutamate synthase